MSWLTILYLQPVMNQIPKKNTYAHAQLNNERAILKNLQKLDIINDNLFNL